MIVEESRTHESEQTGLAARTVAGFYLAFQMGLELQLALIEGMDTEDYIESMKKMLFEQSGKTQESHLDDS